ncbi:hypothetical protein LCGC14_0383570 [marine sediment metagenome]|uniref:DNA-directed DNA polymerase family A palm domain-containing protein n=1 Tax=marine sediment metagenome TaxID=412755 RepID=A0A0F9WAM5_9ZZZZ
MYFAHDTESQFYYLGEEQPGPRVLNKWLVDSPPHIIGLDVETISLKERIAIGISIAPAPNVCFYFPLFPVESPVTPWNLLKDPKVMKVIHNAIFDLSVLDEFDIDLENIADTNVMSRLLCHKFNGLSDLGWVHNMEVHEVKELLKEHNAKIMLDMPPDVVARKCMQDSMASLKLYWEFLPQTNLEYFNVEMQTIPIMIRMADKGLLIDHKVRQRLEVELEEGVDAYQLACEKSEAFNPGSPQQVSWILAKRGSYDVFGRLPFTRDKYGRSTGKLSTAKEVLQKMVDPLAQLVLNYRTVKYVLSHYVVPWAEEERATTRYHLDAITGRPSSTNPNMQNIPGIKSPTGYNARAMLLPDSGTWTDMDFSQLELRILANLSQDREMLHIYETEGDIHQYTADFLGIQRPPAKNTAFAMIYGGTDSTIAETAHVPIQRAKQLKEAWFNLYPQAGDYIQTMQEDVKRGRNIATTMFGRNMRLPADDEESLDARQRKSINYPIQGTAADILKRALIHCRDMDIRLQVHDELLIDGIVLPDKFSGLENIAKFRTPIEIRYLERWE